MRSFVLKLLLVLITHQIIGSDGFTFIDNDLYDGDPCELHDGTIGQCRKQRECGVQHTSRTKRCEFEGDDLIVCCDVVQKQCDSIGLTTKRINDHIIGDADAIECGEFPFMALLIYPTLEFRCGASLISSRFLLTAAHCIVNQHKEKPIAAKLGTTDAEDSLAPRIDIKDTFVHEGFKSQMRLNDIAVVELVKAAELNSLIQPICLQANEDNISKANEMIILGWGIKNENFDTSNQLLKGVVHPVPLETCKTRFQQVHARFNLTDYHLCALGTTNAEGIATDSCQGDSGGPLILKKNDKHCLVGITSTGGTCGNEHLSGIYVKVSKYLDWIIKKGVWSGL